MNVPSFLKKGKNESPTHAPTSIIVGFMVFVCEKTFFIIFISLGMKILLKSMNNSHLLVPIK